MVCQKSVQSEPKDQIVHRSIWTFRTKQRSELTQLGANEGFITGWWYTYPSEKYEFVSWDDEIPN
jgi:hypothetical protein